MFNLQTFFSGGEAIAVLYPLPTEPVYEETPADLFPDMLFDGTYLSIPLAALAPHGLVEEDCNPITGDARAVAYALLARCEKWYTDLEAQPLAFAARPILGIGYSSSDFPGKEKTKLEFTVYRDRPEGTVADEP